MNLIGRKSNIMKPKVKATITLLIFFVSWAIASIVIKKVSTNVGLGLAIYGGLCIMVFILAIIFIWQTLVLESKEKDKKKKRKADNDT